jgi:hypothetical protein
MVEDIETPELVELQDTFANTETTVVNELPSEAEGKEVAEGLTEAQKSSLPPALQKAILAKKGVDVMSKSDDKAGEDEDSTPSEELDIEKALDSKEEEEVDDSIFQNPTELEEPAGEFNPPVEVVEASAINPTPVPSTATAEIYAAHSLAQKVASMPLKDYEEWLFPASGSPDHLRGQMCLARLDASLKAANGGRAVAELWQIKIGSALWSRLNYRNNPIEETRCELEKAPPMEVIPLIPRNASEAISVIEEIQTAEKPHDRTNLAVLGACGVAILLPIILMQQRG